LLVLHVRFKILQGCVPKNLVVVEPIVNSAERFGIQAAKLGGTAFSRGNQSGRTQEPEVLGDGGPAHSEIAGQCADALGLGTEQPEDAAAGRIGDGAEDGV